MLYGKIIFILALMLSFLIHHTAFFVISDRNRKELPQKNVQTVEDEQVIRMSVQHQTEAPEEKQAATPSQEKMEKKPPNKPPERNASATQETVEKMGFAVMEKAKRGEFPPLTIRYSDPEKYLKEMIALGASIALFEESNRKMWKIELPTWRIAGALDQQMLDTFSPFKRVITDNTFETRRLDLSDQVGNTEGNAELVLLVPLKVEARWMGHQMLIFKNHGVAVEGVASVDGTFLNGRLMIERFILSDGEVRRVRRLTG